MAANFNLPLQYATTTQSRQLGNKFESLSSVDGSCKPFSVAPSPKRPIFLLSVIVSCCHSDNHSAAAMEVNDDRSIAAGVMASMRLPVVLDRLPANASNVSSASNAKAGRSAQILIKRPK